MSTKLEDFMPERKGDPRNGYSVTFRFHDTDTYCSNLVFAFSEESAKKHYEKDGNHEVSVRPAESWEIEEAKRKGKPILIELHETEYLNDGVCLSVQFVSPAEAYNRWLRDLSDEKIRHIESLAKEFSDRHYSFSDTVHDMFRERIEVASENNLYFHPVKAKSYEDYLAKKASIEQETERFENLIKTLFDGKPFDRQRDIPPTEEKRDETFGKIVFTCHDMQRETAIWHQTMTDKLDELLEALEASPEETKERKQTFQALSKTRGYTSKSKSHIAEHGSIGME